MKAALLSMQAFHTEGPDLADRCLEMVRKRHLGYVVVEFPVELTKSGDSETFSARWRSATACKERGSQTLSPERTNMAVIE